MAVLVHYEVADGVGTITLDSPHNRNALSRQLTTELLERLDRAAADDDAVVVVIRSADLIRRIDDQAEPMAALSARLFGSDAAREAMLAFLSRTRK